ncbi:calmodulin-binding protein [Streptomyces sp. NBC_01190]|uniref:BP74-related protein n=1 Tax=Streptomyces sp. NBC_01190 TaxID=2903767 RepID=UPI003862E7DE|nr:calmodulin-binding protein [Streptomyces sp. NBC_01190]
MRRILSKLGTLAAVALLACTATQSTAGAVAAPAAATAVTAVTAADRPAYFTLRDVQGSHFIIEITNHATIAEAREIIREGERKIVIGRIVKRPAPYNPQWSFHFNPDTIAFADMAIEVCDATTSYVEDHLDEAGGPFLPGLYWCPWTGRLINEVTPD